MTHDRMRTTVLVTGAAGFIGSVLCRRLLERGHAVVGLDDLSRGRREHVPSAVDFVEGDIRDSDRVRAIIAARRPETIIHLAAMHFIPDCIARPRDTIDVNVEGTRRLLEGSVGAEVVRHFIFASTAAVYAPGEEPCVEDSTPLGPLEIYGESKLEGEGLVRAFCQNSRMSGTILRLFNAIGRNETNPHVLPHLFESLRSSDVVELGNTAPRRDYIDTRDIAEAIVAAMGYSPGVEVMNVGTGSSYSVAEIVARLSAILGRRITVVTDPARVRASDRMNLLADITRIRRLTRWSPRYAIEDTLRDMVEAYDIRHGHEPPVDPPDISLR